MCALGVCIYDQLILLSLVSCISPEFGKGCRMSLSKVCRFALGQMVCAVVGGSLTASSRHLIFSSSPRHLVLRLFRASERQVCFALQQWSSDLCIYPKGREASVVDHG